MLYWRTMEKIERDYTVFVHLMDGAGKIVDGYDSQPSSGMTPTHTWIPGALTADAIVMPIAPEVLPGQDYRLAIGLYDLATMRRLLVIDEHGAPITDTLVLSPFKIE